MYPAVCNFSPFLFHRRMEADMEEAPVLKFIWWKALISLVFIVFSGIFSGLTLGLMGQDITQLTVLAESGEEKEKRRAKKILPVRKNGNLLLCTLLLGNVLVNSALSIFMSEMTGGILGLITSTFFIVIFGEIIPQVCVCGGLQCLSNGNCLLVSAPKAHLHTQARTCTHTAAVSA